MSAVIPGKGTFSIYPGLKIGSYVLKVVFEDRARLEVPLTPDLAINVNDSFKFMDSYGTVHELPWNSSVKAIVAPNVDTYLKDAVWFIQAIQETDKQEEIKDVAIQAESAVTKIRAMRAIHLRRVVHDA